jgi:hypothetical protein
LVPIPDHEREDAEVAVVEAAPALDASERAAVTVTVAVTFDASLARRQVRLLLWQHHHQHQHLLQTRRRL